MIARGLERMDNVLKTPGPCRISNASTVSIPQTAEYGWLVALAFRECVLALQGESKRGLAPPRTTTTMAHPKAPPNQPRRHQTDYGLCSCVFLHAVVLTIHSFVTH